MTPPVEHVYHRATMPPEPDQRTRLAAHLLFGPGPLPAQVPPGRDHADPDRPRLPTLLDHETHSLLTAADPLPLTRAQYQVLATLAEVSPRSVKHDELLDAIDATAGTDPPEVGQVAWHVCRLRAMLLEHRPDVTIDHRRGWGYSLQRRTGAARSAALDPEGHQTPTADEARAPVTATAPRRIL